MYISCFWKFVRIFLSTAENYGEKSLNLDYKQIFPFPQFLKKHFFLQHTLIDKTHVRKYFQLRHRYCKFLNMFEHSNLQKVHNCQKYFDGYDHLF